LTLPTLQGERVVLRPRRDEDADALAAILQEPEVAPWWGAWDADRVREDLGEGFVILVDGRVSGYLGFEEEDDPDYRHVSLDIFLASSARGRGYGRAALRLLVDHFVERGHHRFTIDPAVENEAAIRAYAAIGFKPVGVLRSYERRSDGAWHDNLLMDLLATD